MTFGEPQSRWYKLVNVHSSEEGMALQKAGVRSFSERSVKNSRVFFGNWICTRVAESRRYTARPIVDSASFRSIQLRTISPMSDETTAQFCRKAISLLEPLDQTMVSGVSRKA